MRIMFLFVGDIYVHICYIFNNYLTLTFMIQLWRMMLRFWFTLVYQPRRNNLLLILIFVELMPHFVRLFCLWSFFYWFENKLILHSFSKTMFTMPKKAWMKRHNMFLQVHYLKKMVRKIVFLMTVPIFLS